MQENSKQDIENKEAAAEPKDAKSTEAGQTAEKHHLHPTHWIGGFEFLGHAHLLRHLRDMYIDLFVCLLVDAVEMFIQTIFGQQDGVCTPAMLLDKVKMKMSVFANFIVCLL